MSARVVGSLAPAGKPHPTAKWSLLMALLVVVVLGVPKFADAGPPAVQSPTGPMSGSVFTGVYTFGTYISCTSGFSFSSSYSNNLEGTHNYAFWGAADGSLLVSVDGGGLMLVTSCGDPLTGPNVNVANFSVTKYAGGPPPTPTPSPTPTPTPGHTPTPTPSPGHTPTPGGGPSGGGTSTPTPGSGAPVQPTQAPGEATPVPSDPASSTPSPAATPANSKPGEPTPTSQAVGGGQSAAASTHVLAWILAGIGGGILFLLLVLVVRIRRLREALAAHMRRVGLRIEPYWFKVTYRLRHHAHPAGKHEPKRKGLAHHKHSGKLMAHHHTSYPSLIFLLILSAVLTAAYSMSTRADSSLLSFSVLGPPPTAAATIDQPIDGEHFAVSTQTVRGTCPIGLMIEIYRNGVFAGSALCDLSGLYNVVITLVPGQNDLVARDLDGLSQYGPDSATVTVYYDVPPPTPTPTPTPTPVATPTPQPSPGAATPTASPGPSQPKPIPQRTPAPTGNPFYIESPTHFYQGADPSASVSWTIITHGGTPPYKITWDWGDSKRDAMSQSSPGDITNTHHYLKPGIYKVTIRATDRAGREATISVMAIINGAGAGGVVRPIEPPGNLIYIWPLVIIASLLVISFWLGERYKQASAPQIAQ